MFRSANFWTDERTKITYRFYGKFVSNNINYLRYPVILSISPAKDDKATSACDLKIKQKKYTKHLKKVKVIIFIQIKWYAYVKHLL